MDENKRYPLEKVQEEATKLREKIKSGERTMVSFNFNLVVIG